MDYFQLSTFGAIAGTLSMLLVYVYLYILYREHYMGMWIISWTVFFLRVAFFDSGLLSWEDSIIGFIAYQLFYVVGPILTIYAIHLFINKPLRKYWIYGAVLTAILSMATTIMQMPIIYKLIPITWFACIMLICIGNIFINIKTRGVGKYITGGAFILWGLVTSAIPFSTYNDEIPWQINLICGILRLLITSGTLMVYFEKTRADLITNQKSLQQTNLELNHFCHSVAHDFKSPLLSINQLAEYLSLNYSDELDDKGKVFLKHIQNKSAEVITITDHLLELSRMSQKKINIKAINLESLFCEVYDELIQLQPERQVVFTIKSLPDIQGDPIMIKILVHNILSNALKYTRNRQQSLIEVDSMENENEYLIAVKDNGAGFDMRDSARLFTIFERLHSVEEFEGTGVGLVICQKILKRHYGKVWLTGMVDEGAIFSFSFPKDMEKQLSSPASVLLVTNELA